MNHVLYTYFIVCIYNKDQAVYVKVIFTTIFSFDIFIVFFLSSGGLEIENHGKNK